MEPGCARQERYVCAYVYMCVCVEERLGLGRIVEGFAAARFGAVRGELDDG